MQIDAVCLRYTTFHNFCITERIKLIAVVVLLTSERGSVRSSDVLSLRFPVCFVLTLVFGASGMFVWLVIKKTL